MKNESSDDIALTTSVNNGLLQRSLFVFIGLDEAEIELRLPT